jgi:hypothetical protein
MAAMERPEQEEDQERPAPSAGDLGADHRDGPPGYDFDEQAAIEELKKAGGSGGRESKD